MKYYWFDDGDYTACGSYDSYAEAVTAAEECSCMLGNHTKTYTILSVAGVSGPPSLKRKWKSA